MYVSGNEASQLAFLEKFSDPDCDRIVLLRLRTGSTKSLKTATQRKTGYGALHVDSTNQKLTAGIQKLRHTTASRLQLSDFEV